MNIPAWIRPLFILAAVYDGALGLLFLVAPRFLFDQYGVPPPNHPAYVQFPAALLVIFAFMFINIARDPLPNRPLIPYGVLLKVAYCGVAGWYWLQSGIPGFWKPFAVIDLIMAVLFAWAYAALDAASIAEPTIRPNAKEVES